MTGTAAVVTCTGSRQSAFQHGGGDHEPPPLTEELLAVNGYWGRVSQCGPGRSTKAEVDSHPPMRIWEAQIGLISWINENKKRIQSC